MNFFVVDEAINLYNRQSYVNKRRTSVLNKIISWGNFVFKF